MPSTTVPFDKVSLPEVSFKHFCYEENFTF